MNLNIPETRQNVLEDRLRGGIEIVATEFAAEFDISVDTVRRDIIALETAGKARRVRGGAVPLAAPARALHTRLTDEEPSLHAIVTQTLAQLDGCATVILDGGATTLALARRLDPAPDRFVITASPWIAVACQERGIEVFMLGGRLSAQGGVNVGDGTRASASDLAADVAILGACGLDPDFGLSSDDAEEAALKQAVSRAATRTIVITSAEKIGRRARHRTLAPGDIDLVVTDADPSATEALQHAGPEVINV